MSSYAHLLILFSHNLLMTPLVLRRACTSQHILPQRPKLLSLPTPSRGDRARTCDPMLPKHVRYQLRYTPNYYLYPNNSVLVHPQAVFPGSTPVIPLNATLHALYLELLTSSYIYSYYLLRFTPQCCSNPLSSFREFWVTHDLSITKLIELSYPHRENRY